MTDSERPSPSSSLKIPAMSDFVSLQRSVVETLLLEARRLPEQECCGLLAGRDGISTTVLSAPNALASATAYEIAPAELFALFRRMRAERLDHLGIYHSHPQGDNAPSPRERDRRRPAIPKSPTSSSSPRMDAPRPVRAFHNGAAIRRRKGSVRTRACGCSEFFRGIGQAGLAAPSKLNRPASRPPDQCMCRAVGGPLASDADTTGTPQ